MAQPNFCVECGARLTASPWRIWLGQFCKDCAPRNRRTLITRFLITATALIALGFACGRYYRTATPPLTIERAANSPLSDLPVNSNSSPGNPGRQSRTTAGSDSLSKDGVADSAAGAASSNLEDAVYLCGARTRKGTPCQRRVHMLGERCYQHKGRPAMVPLEKLVIKS
jgi:hypothetical protein